MKAPSRIGKSLEARVSAVAQRLNKTPAVVLEEAIDEYTARHDPGVAERTLRRIESSPDALMGRLSGHRLVDALERDRRSRRER